MLDRTTEPQTEQRDGPDLYTGLSFEIEQILLGCAVLTSKVRELNGCFDHKQAVSLKLAADDIAKTAGQINIMAAHVSSVVARHVNRRSRVS